MIITTLGLAAAICSLLLTSPAVAEDENPLAKYLDVPGATVTLPVSDAKQLFPLEFALDARERFENFHYQMGSDHALHYNANLIELLDTAVSSPNERFMPLWSSQSFVDTQLNISPP